NHDQNRAKDFLLGNLHGIVNVRKDGRTNEQTLAIGAVNIAIPAGNDLGTFLLAQLNVGHDLFKVLKMALRALTSGFRKRISTGDGSGFRHDTIENFLVDILLYEPPSWFRALFTL